MKILKFIIGIIVVIGVVRGVVNYTNVDGDGIADVATAVVMTIEDMTIGVLRWLESIAQRG